MGRHAELEVAGVHQGRLRASVLPEEDWRPQEVESRTKNVSIGHRSCYDGLEATVMQKYDKNMAPLCLSGGQL